MAPRSPQHDLLGGRAAAGDHGLQHAPAASDTRALAVGSAQANAMRPIPAAAAPTHTTNPPMV